MSEAQALRRTSNDPKIDELLGTVKIPCWPPNRSQWRKLDLAIKFINISKKCVADKAGRRKSMKIEPKSGDKENNDIKIVKKNTKIEKVGKSLGQIA